MGFQVAFCDLVGMRDDFRDLLETLPPEVSQAVEDGLRAGVSSEIEESRARVIAGVKGRLISADAEKQISYFGVGTKKVRSWDRWVAGVGALTTLAIVALLGTQQYLSPLIGSKGSTKQGFYEYTTAPGERATVTLRDGTKVVLNVDTRVRVPNNFGERDRILQLDGEAQFTVVHDTERPFVIKTRGVEVRDLATEFIVQSYKGSAAVTVAVNSGHVAVKPALLPEPVMVGADRVVVVALDGATHPVVSDIKIPDAYFGWVDGRLALRKVPLRDAIVMLSRWYGLEFKVTDPAMLSHTVNARFGAQFDLEKLKAFADILGADFTRSGQTVTLSRR